MHIPISKRLRCCAGLIDAGARVADIGTDHGYLAIYLLQNQLAASVIAADLRTKPLDNARANARRFGLQEQITFVQSDGLADLDPVAYDTVVCAGMGGDLIAQILAAAPWLRSRGDTLILQPQSAVHALRRWLNENGFAVQAERLVQDGGFLYPVMRVQAGDAAPLTPGQHFVPQHLAAEPLLAPYLLQMRGNLQKTVAGLAKARSDAEREKLTYYAAALREVEEMRIVYGIGE